VRKSTVATGARRLLLAGTLLVCACARADRHDTPVPAGERRETVEITVDLAWASRCDEVFDLALYQRRGVDLVEWAPGGHGCSNRRAKIRYLPSRISRSDVVKLAQKAARKVEVVNP
jgi:hypothetical protein